MTKALELLPVVSQLESDVAQLPPLSNLPNFYTRRCGPKRTASSVKFVAEFAVAKDVQALEQENMDGLIARARTLVRQLPVQVAGQAAAVAPPTAVVAEPAISLFSRVGDIAKTLWSAVSSTREVDLLWLLVAIAIAVWSGFALYYVGKPWGRPGDFVILFVWAFGATTILTSVLSALENVAAGPLPLRPPEARDVQPKQ